MLSSDGTRMTRISARITADQNQGFDPLSSWYF
jgi:hypothetical protein